jgi:small subunit ribosomal protein S16
MSVKIRLQRHGKKSKPFYWIVAADARSKRDGRLLEKLGTYNPNTNPATIDLDIDGSVKWLQKGAQPTDTARAILSYKGALLKNHLEGGIKKGALTEKQAEEKFSAWLEEKNSKINAKTENLAKTEKDAKAKALESEKEINEKRLAAVQEAENIAIKAEADAKTKAEEVVAEGLQTIDDAVAEAEKEITGDKEVPVKENVEEAVENKAEVKAEAPQAEEVTVAKVEEATGEEEKEKKIKVDETKAVKKSDDTKTKK